MFPSTSIMADSFEVYISIGFQSRSLRTWSALLQPILAFKMPRRYHMLFEGFSFICDLCLVFELWYGFHSGLVWLGFCGLHVICRGVSFLWGGTFFFILVKDLSMPSSTPIIWRFGLFVVSHISCLFLSYFSYFFHILCLFHLDSLLYIQALIYHLLVDVFILLEFSSWVIGTFDYVFISVWSLLNVYGYFLNFVFNSWTVFVI